MDYAPSFFSDRRRTLKPREKLTFHTGILIIFSMLTRFIRSFTQHCTASARNIRGLLASTQHVQAQSFLARRRFFCLKGQNYSPFRRKELPLTGIGENKFETTCLSNTAGQNHKDPDIMARATNRTTITLTDAEVEALDRLKEHFDTPSVSETIRRSISQSSVLKRYSDEEGDLVVERDGRRYVIPSKL